MNKQSETQSFWQAYIDSLPAGGELPPDSYEVWSFGNSATLANELGHLAKTGLKTATCGPLWAYQAEHEPLPQPGDLSLITDGEGAPLCIIETTEVQVKAFNEVDEQFAYDEGEGDRSLAYWRAVHWDAFSRECETIGRKPDETMPLVCERFRLVFAQ